MIWLLSRLGSFLERTPMWVRNLLLQLLLLGLALTPAIAVLCWYWSR